MKPEALVILTPGFPEDEADSTCIPPQQVFVKALQQTGTYTVIILTLQYPFHSSEYRWNGIKVISFGNGRNSRLLRMTTGFRVTTTLKRLQNKFGIKGILSFWFGRCALIANKFAKRHGIKHYSWILGQDAKPCNKYFRKIKPDAGSLIALSDFIAAEFNKNYGVKPSHLIPVGIDTTLFCKGGKERDVDILGVGSLIPLKQYAILLEMVCALKQWSPNIRAVLCGDGPEMAGLKALAKEMNLENNVTFAGRQPHQEVLKLMQRSKILLHPSRYEGFGAVCLEALYAGAHVVSFVKPMNKPVENWQNVTGKEEMLLLLKKKLTGPQLSHQPVLPFTIEANAKAMAALFV